MPRKYAVLRQFTLDLDRLLLEAERAYAGLKGKTQFSQAEILQLYRPIHSLKGICGMVEEAKVLVKAFHLLEDALPPLLPVAHAKKGQSSQENWGALTEATFQLAHEVERILLAKLDLWKKLGADDDEARGLVVHFLHEGKRARVWVPITSLVGLEDGLHLEANQLNSVAILGRVRDESGHINEGLVIETSEGLVALCFDEIETTCGRTEALQMGNPTPFKDWWASHVRKKGSGQSAA